MFLIFSGIGFSQGKFNPRDRVDTTITKFVDLTSDKVLDEVLLKIRARNFYFPFAWELIFKNDQGKILFSYSEQDSSSEFRFTDDPDCKKNYLKCKYDYFFKEFVGLHISDTVDFGDYNLLFSKTYGGSIYNVAGKYLTDSCKVSSKIARQMIDKIILKIKKKTAPIIIFNKEDVETSFPMVFFPEISRLVPIYSD